jgi:DnaJ family protein C protein 3
LAPYIEYDPNDYISYYKRATAYLSLGKTNPAIDDFSKILTLKPGFKQALLERAKLYLADGEYKLAKQDLEGVNQDDSTKLLVMNKPK